MKRVLVMLVAGTVLSGLAAAYATTAQRVDEATVADPDSTEYQSPYETTVGPDAPDDEAPIAHD